MSTSFSLREAIVTHAQATVDGKNAENLMSESEKNVIYLPSERTLNSGGDLCRVGGNLGVWGGADAPKLDTPWWTKAQSWS